MSTGLAWGLRAAIAIPAVIWIGGEFLYAGVSAANGDNGDFGKIANKGWIHLLIATAIVLTICALCALGVTFLLI